jgi:Uncharacterised BCR, YnfA/UPF0060 family
MGPVARSIVYFLLAGLLEIVGGYLVWLWLREGRPVWLGGPGLVTLERPERPVPERDRAAAARLGGADDLPPAESTPGVGSRFSLTIPVAN